MQVEHVLCSLKHVAQKLWRNQVSEWFKQFQGGSAWKILQEVVKKCRSHAHADKRIKSCLFRQGQTVHYNYHVEMRTRLCEALCTEEPELRPNNYKFENYSTSAETSYKHFCHLKGFLNKRWLIKSPECDRCKQASEMASHFLCNCEVLAALSRMISYDTRQLWGNLC
jgi:hypothetical protein